MMDASIHILLIEDDPAHAELVQRAFEERGDQARLTVANTLNQARAFLENFIPTLVIADWRLPDGESHELLVNRHNAIPIVVMTSYGSERTAVDVIKAGALDYIVKSSESMTDMPHIAERAIQQWKSLQEQEHFQKALAESEAQFRLLAENASDMISRHDVDGNFVYISPACFTLLGYKPEELVGRSVMSLIHPEDSHSIIKLLDSHSWNDSTITVSYRAKNKQAKHVWMETSARFIFDENRQIMEIQASSRDITERKKAQEDLLRAHKDLQDAYEKTIRGWVHALDLRDKETEDHTRRVTEITDRLARLLGFSEEDIAHIRRGVLLHDIGKMGIPDEILQKPGPLTEDEWAIMRRHPEFAYQMLSGISYLEKAIDIPYSHHERWDGSGYPRGLKGEKIPLFARMFAIIDVWDALISDRPYRKKIPQDQVIGYIKQEAGRLFDPKIVEIFIPMPKELPH